MPPNILLQFQLLAPTFALILTPILLQSASNVATMDHGKRLKPRRRHQLDQPELTLVRQGEEADPRLVELIRLLARRAAREVYRKQMKERRLRRP